MLGVALLALEAVFIFSEPFDPDIAATARIVIPIAIVAGGIGTYIGIKLQTRLLVSYRLIINNEGIGRKQDNTPDMFLEHESIAMSLLLLPAMYAVYQSNNKPVVAISGAFAVYQLIQSWRAMNNNTILDGRTRKLSWVILLPLISIFFITILKLAGIA